MTVDEFAKLADAIKTYFPRDNMLPTDESMELWFDMLNDLDYLSAYASLKKHVATSKFPPTIADIREGTTDFLQPQELNEMEAWSLVYNAICNSTYNSVSEFEKLPPLVQKAVGLPDSLREWAMTENLNLEVVMSNFQRAYKAELKRHEELQKMPQNVRQLIEKANVGSYSAQISEKRQKAIESASERKQGEIKALEMKHEGVPMPEKYKERLEDMRNGE